MICVYVSGFETQALLPSSIEANIHRRSNRIQLQHTPNVKNHGANSHLWILFS